MTHRDTGLLTFRALSIYALIRAFEQTEWILYRWPDTQELSVWPLIVYLGIFTPFLLLIIFSMVLWRGAPRLINRMFTEDNQIAEFPSVTVDDMKSVVFLGIGLYILVDTIPSLVQTILSIYASFTSSIDPSSHTQVTILRLTTIFKIGLGLWLVVGTKGLTNILKKIRHE